jgi:FecR protein
MSKRIIASITLFAFLGLGTPALAGPESTGTPAGVVIESSMGDITTRSDSATWSDFEASGLPIGESVKVGSKGQATLLFPDGSRIRVSPNSEFRIVANDQGLPEMYLLSGKVLAAMQSSGRINTFRSDAISQRSEFVLETNPSGTSLKVLSGNASMSAAQGDEAIYDRLASLPDSLANSSLLAFDRLAAEQHITSSSFGAQGKGKKGGGIRDATVEEQTGGVGEVSPDQDMVSPGKKAPAAVVETPPAATPPTATPPAAAVPAATPPIAAVPASIGPWPFILGGLGTALGIAALVVASDDDNNNNVQVPSPSLP